MNPPIMLMVDGYSLEVHLTQDTIHLRPRESIYHRGDTTLLGFLLKIRSETFIHLLRQKASFRLDNIGFDFVEVAEIPYVYDSVLTDLRKRIGDLGEPVWVFYVERFYAMNHHSLLKLLHVIQQVLTGQGIPALQGVETLEWTVWEQRFGFAKQTGIDPNQLLQLEPIAAAYLLALENSAPNLESLRTALLQQMDLAALLNRDCRGSDIGYQLDSEGFVALKQCFWATQELFEDTKQPDYALGQQSTSDVRDLNISLDWVLRQSDFPTEGTISKCEFRRDCAEYFFRQEVQNLEPIEFEYHGVHLLLEPVLDMGRIKLAFARRVHPKSPTEALEIEAHMQKQGMVRFGG